MLTRAPSRYAKENEDRETCTGDDIVIPPNVLVTRKRVILVHNAPAVHAANKLAQKNERSIPLGQEETQGARRTHHGQIGPNVCESMAWFVFQKASGRKEATPNGHCVDHQGHCTFEPHPGDK